MFFAIFNAILLGFISLIHFYWLVGGRWGSFVAIPTSKEGKSTFQPGMFATLTVALGLFFMALLHIDKAGLVELTLPDWIDTYALKIIAFIFLIRAIGEFRYIGFFKKITNTPFARSGTWLYSPLCLLLSLNALLTSLQI
ncbi:DUF3995 domain-containing protein [Emticicia sp. BO119]|uniref:DUF3995 domain-containing protein n=1 Tax=Emticicia sp. BO119 TaxID=2757768 RepID=UPI0015F05D4B|nr:DUF3995 domain-containing protein [Emticicia sp. BO119]MBA4851762.1 DUF3995 domain-containing protein [Emticicia sp. BO119]